MFQQFVKMQFLRQDRDFLIDGDGVVAETFADFHFDCFRAIPAAAQGVTAVIQTDGGFFLGVAAHGEREEGDDDCFHNGLI